MGEQTAAYEAILAEGGAVKIMASRRQRGGDGRRRQGDRGVAEKDRSKSRRCWLSPRRSSRWWFRAREALI